MAWPPLLLETACASHLQPYPCRSARVRHRPCVCGGKPNRMRLEALSWLAGEKHLLLQAEPSPNPNPSPSPSPNPNPNPNPGPNQVEAAAAPARRRVGGDGARKLHYFLRRRGVGVPRTVRVRVRAWVMARVRVRV